MSKVLCKNRVWQDPLYFMAYGFGSGLMPVAPGTWGTLAAVPIYLLIAGMSGTTYLILTLAAFFFGVVICEKVSSDLGVHDDPGIVWDEIVGYLLTMAFAPVSVLWMVVGFVLFRLFDIWKPQPIRYVDQQIQGGLGIMLDDVLAAVPAWIIMQLLIWGFA
ncbi:MAG: phosphatidylglycerophosphatase A [Legionellales bacterium]|nr:phosphatidylglycerophosphatase A [Legionellales bacterium]